MTSSQATRTVLVVEDERVVAKDLQQTLIQLGYRVPVTVASAEDAFRAAANECPDLVLIDIRIRGDIEFRDNEDVPRNEVFEQDPNRDTFVDPGTVVDLVISSGM